MTAIIAFVANLFSNSRADQMAAASNAIKAALESGDRMALAHAIENAGAAIRA